MRRMLPLRTARLLARALMVVLSVLFLALLASSCGRTPLDDCGVDCELGGTSNGGTSTGGKANTGGALPTGGRASGGGPAAGGSGGVPTTGGSCNGLVCNGVCIQPNSDPKN